jgi:hypothetical protein
VGELDADARSVSVQLSDDALQFLRLAIVPEAEVPWTDATVGGHPSRLDDDGAGAAAGELSEVDPVPIGRDPVHRLG